MTITLEQILGLTGPLDDATGEDSPRGRFRAFLTRNVTGVGQLRGYVEDCLRRSDEQYSRALQDLVNHVGQLLGFEVVFGDYSRLPGEVGFDGYWRSPKGFHVVLEIRTGMRQTVKTGAFIACIEELISEHRIPDWDAALGMYVVGRPDGELRRLEAALLEERRAPNLRIVTADSVLRLASLLQNQHIDHDGVLTVLRPSNPWLDDTIQLMASLVGLGPGGPVDLEIP